MIHTLQNVLNRLFSSDSSTSIFEPEQQFRASTAEAELPVSLNAAFLIALQGKYHPDSARARQLLDNHRNHPEWGEQAQFYLRGIAEMEWEIHQLQQRDAARIRRLKELARFLEDPATTVESPEFREKVWSFFFPEACGILANRKLAEEQLRRQRTVSIATHNTEPIRHPAREILFTANVLLTVPVQDSDALPLAQELRQQLRAVMQESQLYWYDHPIPLGIPPENNEVIYGLRALDQAMEFEKKRGNFTTGEKLVCLLSVSVTHQGLHAIATEYLKEEFRKAGGFPNLQVFLFSENETRALLQEVLLPAIKHYIPEADASPLETIFGVDGEYGRHFSFLKAIAALWQVFIDPHVRATFKIDLDQVFDQQALVKETGKSALEHLTTSLWGATGYDADGHPVHLGMVAGALVNEQDIRHSLFTPDVPYPEEDLSPDQYIFFSALPQAVSTRAEMMTRYESSDLDGKTRCLQRIHVTGGTTGILISALRHFRPFTPTFIGRAEDQAYILSVIHRPGNRLAYLHQAGLIMRHDKEAFAGEAIRAAAIGKQIGDYIRILYFSEYARTLSSDIEQIKHLVDPFTGCFITPISRTVVFLRFALTVANYFARGEQANGKEFLKQGVRRINKALDFTQGSPGALTRQYLTEQKGWELYYRVLDILEARLRTNDSFARRFQQNAQRIIRQSRISETG